MEITVPYKVEYLINIAGTGLVDCSFTELQPGSVRTPRAPSFLFGTVPGPVLNLYHTRTGMPQKGAWTIRDVQVSGEYLLTAGAVALADNLSNIHHPHIEIALKQRRPEHELTKRSLPGRHIFLGGPGMRIYGHWLIEILPKLHVLEALGYDLNTASFLLPSTLRPFAKEWLDILGIRDDQFALYDADNEIVEVGELVLASILHNGVRAVPALADAAALLVRRIEANIGPLGVSPFGRKIFLSRKNIGLSRHLLNREAIENIARESGFEIVVPEKLSIPEQIALFRGARHIMGEYGSALHGSIFSPPGAVVCGLRGSTLHPGFIQSGIGYALKQPTGYVFGQSEAAAGPDRFLIDEGDFRACLRYAMNDILIETDR